MPHSSGGGSHGGGSHGGSHSSSHGGSHGGGNSSRISSRAFKGATRYVYYSNNKANYVYANYDITKKPSIARFALIIFYLPFFITSFVLLIGSFIDPNPIDSSSYNSSIVIEDNIGVLGDTTELEKSMQEFLDTTGIAPAVITIHNEDWRPYYSTLENCAYDLYVNHFYDEKHWLIVYSEPISPDVNFNDWYWEGMQGDDTDPIITDSVADKFNRAMQDSLLRSNDYTVSSAISNAFNTVTPGIMDKGIDFEGVFMGLIFLSFTTFHCCAMLGISPKRFKYRKATRCSLTPSEFKCKYCGGIYVIGTCTTCPHCGAPLSHVEEHSAFG